MDHVTSTLIDLVEAAFDLDLRDSEWLSGVITAGLRLLDHGLGVAGGIYAQAPSGGGVELEHFHVAGWSEECARRFARIAGEARISGERSGACMTISEAAGEQYARALSSWTSDYACAKDALGLWAADSRGRGAFILAPLPERTRLAGHMRHRWQMVGTHLTTGFRLRRALAKLDESGLPRLRAPNKELEASRALRDAAVLVDCAGGRMSEADESVALRLGQSLAGGAWSLLDCFDVGGRRYVIAVRNPPGVNDPRRLTKREAEVAGYAALGESGKQIGFRLGLSTSRVSGVLHDVKRKLRVHTQAELVNRMRRLHVV